MLIFVHQCSSPQLTDHLRPHLLLKLRSSSLESSRFRLLELGLDLRLLCLSTFTGEGSRVLLLLE